MSMLTRNIFYAKSYVLLLPFQLVLRSLKLVDALAVSVLGGDLLSLQVVGGLLQGVVDCLPQSVGGLHLRISPLLVVAAVVLPLLWGGAPVTVIYLFIYLFIY